MSKDLLVPPTSRSWRDIPQQVKPRAMSREGRRRVVMNGVRMAGGALSLLIALWGCWEISSVVRDKPGKLTVETRSDPVKHLVLVTDGVLDNTWLARTVALPKNASLMGIDLLNLREKVLVDGQVCSAAIIRNFPDTLTVRISERSPVARIMAQVGDGPPKAFLVARDGVAFSGTGFDPAMIAGLPWLDGVKLVGKAGGFAPVEGMDVAADLLAMAKLEAEPLYRTWQVVSLARLSSDREIEIRTRDGLKILFGADEDYLRQLARLDLLIESSPVDSAHALRAVNLSLGSEVPVAYGDPAQAPLVHAQVRIVSGPLHPAQAEKTPGTTAASIILPTFSQF